MTKAKPLSSTAVFLNSGTEEVCIDIVEDTQNYQRPMPRGQGELIAKAVGLNKGYKKILDGTAGLLQDAVSLARLGAFVLCLERQEVIFEVMQEALMKAQAEKQKDWPWLLNLKLVHTETLTYLQKISDVDRPEVIYLDPMFAKAGEKSLPRKELQVLRKIAGVDEDFLQVFVEAKKVALKRVVVKTPIQGDSRLPKSDFQYEGKSVVYRVYPTSFDGATKV